MKVNTGYSLKIIQSTFSSTAECVVYNICTRYIMQLFSHSCLVCWNYSWNKCYFM